VIWLFNSTDNYFDFIYKLISEHNIIYLSIREIYAQFKKFISKQYIIDLLNECDGVEIYNVMYDEKSIFKEMYDFLFFYKLKYNIDIECINCQQMDKVRKVVTKNMLMIIFNDMAIRDFVCTTDKLIFEDIRQLFSKLNIYKIKKYNHTLYFKNNLSKDTFCIKLCNTIINNGNIKLKKFCKGLYKNVL